MNDRLQLGTCIRCDVPVLALEHMPDNPDDAMEGIMRGHYGSRNDCCEFKAWICDDCAHIVSPQMTHYLGPEKGETHDSLSRERYAEILEQLQQDTDN